jgi:hypothetical protein
MPTEVGRHSNAGHETAGKPASPARSRGGGGAFVVVRARESPAPGERRQSMSLVAAREELRSRRTSCRAVIRRIHGQQLLEEAADLP